MAGEEVSGFQETGEGEGGKVRKVVGVQGGGQRLKVRSAGQENASGRGRKLKRREGLGAEKRGFPRGNGSSGRVEICRNRGLSKDSGCEQGEGRAQGMENQGGGLQGGRRLRREYRAGA